ncbi:hypothetical protein WR43_00435 [Mycolicibacter arupensis]|uniref:Uncharacterized protein n=1 Tax=Mycolicibacter arupensis TaxID=342002 RepID=A0A0F5N355_9MYCO|nr:hypothetical protein WR43_00435 [Mycolicibacter arupensis]MCV7276978.1 hypothetical protein [Mycolicibacter arupensis]ORA00964.1 hypothetical protein BST15_02090 [Mycolicibacter arupensis]
MANIDRCGAGPRAVADIVRAQCITRDSFRQLDVMEQITDPGGKSYFVMPRTVGADVARQAVLLTYILNAGTGYGRSGTRTDFPETPYTGAEVLRIRARQRANRWSYAAVPAIRNTGGAVATTPNGLLMVLGGNRVHGSFSHRGGTMWGDLFLVNTRGIAEPARGLREIIESGRLGHGGPDLDSLLHHEEIHAQQWAALGPMRMPGRYLAEEARSRVLGGTNRFEEEAGLRDGGYR